MGLPSASAACTVTTKELPAWTVLGPATLTRYLSGLIVTERLLLPASPSTSVAVTVNE